MQQYVLLSDGSSPLAKESRYYVYEDLPQHAPQVSVGKMQQGLQQ